MQGGKANAINLIIQGNKKAKHSSHDIQEVQDEGINFWLHYLFTASQGS